MAKRSIIAGNEMYVPEARARSLRKQRVARNSRLKDLVFFTGATVFALGVAFAPQIKDGIEFRRTERQAVAQYGDTNGDGFVSRVEEEELLSRIFYKTGITLTPEGAKDFKGNAVPIYEATKIIRDYIVNPQNER